MSDMQVMTFCALALYFFAMIGVGYKASLDKAHHGFEIADRNVGYVPTIGSLATSFRDGLGILFWFGFGVTANYGGLWFFIGVISGLLVYSFIGPKVRRKAKDKGYITINEMLRSRFGVMTERLSALITVFFALALIAVQLFAAGHVFSAVLDVEAWIGVVSIALIVGFYLYFGGYGTVVKTDTIQFFLILSLLVLPFFVQPPLESVLNFSSITSLGFNTSAGFALIGFFFVLGGGETWQRVFSARDDKVVRYGFPLSGVFLFFMTFSLVFLGMACAPFLGDAASSKLAFYEIFKGDFIAPPVLAFIAIIVMAICMSTLDTYCYLVAATLARNFMPKKITGTHKKYVRFTQIIMVLILLGGSILALTIQDALTFAIEAASLLFVLTPVFLYAAFDKPRYRNMRTDALVSVGVLINVCLYLYLFTSGAFENMLMISVPAFSSIALTGGAIYLGKAKKGEAS